MEKSKTNTQVKAERGTTAFQERVYEACCQIPQGKVTTYKAIAAQLGIRSSQAIGQALRCNPYAPRVPCHRVVKSTGEIGGFKGSAQGAEVSEKIKLLEKEGVVVVEGIIDLGEFGFEF